MEYAVRDRRRIFVPAVLPEHNSFPDSRLSHYVTRCYFGLAFPAPVCDNDSVRAPALKRWCTSCASIGSDKVGQSCLSCSWEKIELVTRESAGRDEAGRRPPSDTRLPFVPPTAGLLLTSDRQP